LFQREIYLLSITRKLAAAIARTKFARKAIAENVTLDSLKEKPPGKTLLGLILMLLSYVIGWPMISLFGVLSMYWNEPLMIIAGGPILFVVAHVVFLAGVSLAGSKYLMPTIRWAIRVTLKKLM
jgi:hypothetical protein